MLTPSAPSEVRIEREALRLLLASHHPCLLVLPDPLLEEVGLPLQGDELHPVERILRAPDLRMTQGGEEAVRHEFNVLRHEHVVHAYQVTRQSLADELPLHLHRPADDLVDHGL